MVSERVIGGKTYFYLEHNLRHGRRVVKRERYLGTTIPKNVDRIKREFMDDIYRELWSEDLDRVKAGYAKYRKAASQSARRKATRAFATTFTYNTCRMEGSLLTLNETIDLLDDGIVPPLKSIADIKEAEAHMDAFYDMLGYRRDVSMRTILFFHRRLFKDSRKEIAGKLRDREVRISGSNIVAPRAEDVRPQLVDLFKRYGKSRGRKLHPVELAGLMHLRLVTILPFTDGNGRVGRLMMNLILNKHGFPMFDIPYERRNGYFRALERSQEKGDDNIFLHWFFRRYIAENKKYI
jgi:Fic family protein